MCWSEWIATSGFPCTPQEGYAVAITGACGKGVPCYHCYLCAGDRLARLCAALPCRGESERDHANSAIPSPYLAGGHAPGASHGLPRGLASCPGNVLTKSSGLAITHFSIKEDNKWSVVDFCDTISYCSLKVDKWAIFCYKWDMVAQFIDENDVQNLRALGSSA